MWCFVSLPDATVSEFELSDKARGQELLDSVCKRLGIIEVDYFGLQFSGAKGETLWLNTRNRINRQVSGSPPLRLQFRVKFFVQPHFLLQDASRHQHFLHLRKDFEDGKVATEPEKTARMFALVAQATIGDHSDSHSICSYCQGAENNCSLAWTSDLRLCITQEHEKLQGVKPSTAEYYFLKEIAELENYGMEFHTARNSIGQQLHIGVGSDELRIFDAELNFIERISYNVLKMATHVGKSLFLTVITCEGENVVEFKLMTQGAACAFYRSITEYHAFYRCETVRNAVKSQFTRDLKETLFSLFNEEESDKKYIFDVQRTCKEVYDHYRRVLYNQGCNPMHTVPCDVKQEGVVQDLSDDSDSCQLKDKLNKYEDSFRCKICMDGQINTVLCPCGHMVCCEHCAAGLKSCPLCRGVILQVQKAFLPVANISSAT